MCLLGFLLHSNKHIASHRHVEQRPDEYVVYSTVFLERASSKNPLSCCQYSLLWTMLLGSFIRRQLPTIRFAATVLFVSHTLVDTKVNKNYCQTAVSSAVESSSNYLSSLAFGGFRHPHPLLFLVPANHTKEVTPLLLASHNNQKTTKRKMSGRQDYNSSTGEASDSAPFNNEKNPYLPTMIVFDLDGTYDFFSCAPNGPR